MVKHISNNKCDRHIETDAEHCHIPVSYTHLTGTSVSGVKRVLGIMPVSKPQRLPQTLSFDAVSYTHLLFGDLTSYWIADREGRSMQRLNELYAATGQVGFRVTQRVDGRLVQTEGLKCLAMKSA